MNPLLVKSMTGSAAILPYRIIAPSPLVPGAVTVAAAAIDPLLGVSDSLGCPGPGERLEVHVAGITEIEAGAPVLAGALLTADAAGCAAPAAPAAGANCRIIGVAMEDGALGDVIRVLLAPGSMQG